MRRNTPLLLTLISLLGAVSAARAETRLMEWTFDRDGDAEGWTQTNHLSEVQVAKGALRGRLENWDPFVRSPQFRVVATPYQRVELRLKTDCGGPADLYWTGTTESKYGGFSPKKRTGFTVLGDGKWHEYQVYPFWQSEKQILLLRVDFPRPTEVEYGQKTFELDYVRLVDLGEPTATETTPDWDLTRGAEGWEGVDGVEVATTPEGMQLQNGERATGYVLSPPLRCSLDDNFWVHLEMKADRGSAAYVRWVSSQYANLHSAKFSLKADGKFHTYNIDASGYRQWAGEGLLVGLQPTNVSGATVVIRRFSLGPEPTGGPEVECTYLGLEDALVRAGRQATLLLHLINRGGTATKPGQLRVTELTVPDGIEVLGPTNWRDLPPLAPFEPMSHRIQVLARSPVTGKVRARLATPVAEVSGTLTVLPAVEVPRADYVPEPRPVACDYDLGAFYFPGWSSMLKWDPIRTRAPERRPVLGWYDEGNPECVDWQIKWAVEHGLSYFLVDWYWNAGSRQLEHWVQAFKQARYRRYLKWAVMWANHNAPGSHSEADMRNVAQYWVDHCFGMPEYLRLENKPVVMIWSPQNLARDLGGSAGVKRALTVAREIAVAAGYKGIYFVAMKWPEASTDPSLIRTLAEQGFDMTSIYHYLGDGGKAEDPRDFPFELVAASSPQHWRDWLAAGTLPFLPNLSTGWDSHPWHGDQARRVRGRTVPLFRKICEDAKQFADETGIRRLVLGPLNEWGEGSYAEPNKEFGFGMYDALRDVFCKRPAQGWPPNLAPADVGLGPYDFPQADAEMVVQWTFAHSTEGWAPLMGLDKFRHEGDAVLFRTTNGDPALGVSLRNVPASQYRFLTLRMKLDSATRGEKGQLFWGTLTSRASEANSVVFELIGDSQYHNYVLPLHESPRWRGKINSLRLDPCSHTGAEVALAEVRLSKDPPAE